MNQEVLSIVIPAWNEEKTLQGLVKKVLDVKFPTNLDIDIIIVNDGSTDRTLEIATNLVKQYQQVKLFDNLKNVGKSQSVKSGLLKTIGNIVVIQDADFEYDPNELVNLLRLMQEKNLDVVYGNRFGKDNKVIYWQNYFGNRALSCLSNFFTLPRIHTWLPDIEVCYKMMRGDVARKIAKDIVSKTAFGLEPEITARLSKYLIDDRHLKFGVMPIKYYPRSIAEGKKMHAFKDGLKAFWEIIKFNT